MVVQKSRWACCSMKFLGSSLTRPFSISVCGVLSVWVYIPFPCCTIPQKLCAFVGVKNGLVMLFCCVVGRAHSLVLDKQGKTRHHRCSADARWGWYRPRGSLGESSQPSYRYAFQFWCTLAWRQIRRLHSASDANASTRSDLLLILALIV